MAAGILPSAGWWWISSEGGNPLQALRAGEIDAADIPFRLSDLARALPGFTTTRLDGPFGYGLLYLNMRSAAAP